MSFPNNALTYVSRFAGDLVSLLVGGLSAVPLAYGYIKTYPAWLNWLSLDSVKWGLLAGGFLYVSYRLWLRAEYSRTSDAFHVLVVDAANIFAHLKVMQEDYEWPPTHRDAKGETVKLLWPLRDKGFCSNLSLVRLLCDAETRIHKHNELVANIAEEHGITVTNTLEPKDLNATTMLWDVDKYIENLKHLAMPPKTWVESLSARRIQR